MLKRSLFAETDFLCWKPKPAGQESKRSYSLLETEACWAGEQTKLFSVDTLLLGRMNEQSNNQTTLDLVCVWNERGSKNLDFDHANGELVARVFPPDMFTLQMFCIL